MTATLSLPLLLLAYRHNHRPISRGLFFFNDGKGYQYRYEKPGPENPLTPLATLPVVLALVSPPYMCKLQKKPRQDK